VGLVSTTLLKNERRWGVLNLLRRFWATEWGIPEQVRDSNAIEWDAVPAKGHFSTESSTPDRREQVIVFSHIGPAPVVYLCGGGSCKVQLEGIKR